MRRAILVLATLVAAVLIGVSIYSRTGPLLMPPPQFGTGISRLLGAVAYNGWSWSPDGRYLAAVKGYRPMPECWLCFEEPYSEIILVDLRTMEKRALLRNDGSPYIYYVSWFPDSGRVAYETESHDVLSIQVNGQADTPLPLYEALPIWSADGSKVALKTSTWEDHHWYPRIDVVLISPERTYTLFAGEPDSYLSEPSWSPDGRHVAFAFGLNVPDPSFGAAIYIADIETGGLSRLTQDDNGYFWGSTRPRAT